MCSPCKHRAVDGQFGNSCNMRVNRREIWATGQATGRLPQSIGKMWIFREFCIRLPAILEKTAEFSWISHPTTCNSWKKVRFSWILHLTTCNYWTKKLHFLENCIWRPAILEKQKVIFLQKYELSYEWTDNQLCLLTQFSATVLNQMFNGRFITKFQFLFWLVEEVT